MRIGYKIYLLKETLQREELTILHNEPVELDASGGDNLLFLYKGEDACESRLKLLEQIRAETGRKGGIGLNCLRE